jgi:hypothetical protein
MMKSNFGSKWKPFPGSAKVRPESLVKISGTTSADVSLFLDDLAFY